MNELITLQKAAMLFPRCSVILQHLVDYICSGANIVIPRSNDLTAISQAFEGLKVFVSGLTGNWLHTMKILFGSQHTPFHPCRSISARMVSWRELLVYVNFSGPKPQNIGSQWKVSASGWSYLSSSNSIACNETMRRRCPEYLARIFGHL